MKRILVTAAGSLVPLVGRVSSQTIKNDAERIVRATKGVTDVNDELLVGTIGD